MASSTGITVEIRYTWRFKVLRFLGRTWLTVTRRTPSVAFWMWTTSFIRLRAAGQPWRRLRHGKRQC